MGAQVIYTYCVQCALCCAVQCIVEDGRLVKVLPDPEHPNGKHICPKAAAAPEIVYSPERLRYPIKRTASKGSEAPGWQRISWDEALETIAEKFAEIKRNYGPEAIALYRPARGGSPSQDYEPIAYRLVNCLGSPNALATTHICQWHRDQGSGYTYGGEIPFADGERQIALQKNLSEYSACGSSNLPYPDVEYSNAVMIWGFNPAHSRIGFYHALLDAKARGARLVVVDPRYTEMAEAADIWLQVKPGTDGILAMTLLRVLIDERWYDRDFVQDWTNAPFLVREDNGQLLQAGDILKKGLIDGIEGLNANDPVAADDTFPSLVLYSSNRCKFIARLLPGGEVISLAENDKINTQLDGRLEVTLNDTDRLMCHTVWKGLLNSLRDFSPEETEKLTWVQPDKVRDAAKVIGCVKPLSYYSYNGLEQHLTAMQGNRALCILYTVTGNLGKEGGNLWWPKIPTNDLLGREYLTQEQQAKRIGIQEKPLGPPATGNIAAYDLYSAILEQKYYPVKGLISIGGNLLTCTGDSQRGFQALKALEFFVQLDIFMTPAAQLADIVLPAATPWEGWFVRAGFPYGNRKAQARIQLRQRVVEPQYESKPDAEIVFALAKRLGMTDRFWDGDFEKAMNYFIQPTGLTVEKLRQNPRGVEYPLRPIFEAYKSVDKSTGYIKGFATPSGRVAIYSTRMAEKGYQAIPNLKVLNNLPLQDMTKEFPLILTNFKLLEYIHGQYRAIPSLRRRVPYPFVEINPDTAAREGVSDGQWVYVETPKGRIKLLAKVTNIVPPGVVATQHGWWQHCPELGLPGFDPLSSEGANVNLIIGNEDMDPISGSVPNKSYRCRLVHANSLKGDDNAPSC